MQTQVEGTIKQEIKQKIKKIPRWDLNHDLCLNVDSTDTHADSNALSNDRWALLFFMGAFSKVYVHTTKLIIIIMFLINMQVSKYSYQVARSHKMLLGHHVANEHQSPFTAGRHCASSFNNAQCRLNTVIVYDK